MEFKDTAKDARLKFGVAAGIRDAVRKFTRPMKANEHGEICCGIIEAHESARSRTEKFQIKDHEDLIGEHGFHSLSHCNLVHKPIPIPQVMEILEANTAFDKE